MSGQSDSTLRLLLLVVGIVFIVGVLPLMMLWPSGWQWQPNQSEYEQMIIGVYAVMGIFMVIASKNPAAHRSFILFVAWSSIVHAAVMAYHAFIDTAERGHLLGDVPVLALVGIVFLLLVPKETPAVSTA